MWFRRRFHLLNAKLDLVIKLLNKQAAREIRLMATIDELKAEVAQDTDAMNSAVTLLGNLHDMLVAAQTDPVKLQEVIDTLESDRMALAEAVVANTPAA